MGPNRTLTVCQIWDRPIAITSLEIWASTVRLLLSRNSILGGLNQASRFSPTPTTFLLVRNRRRIKVTLNTFCDPMRSIVQPLRLLSRLEATLPAGRSTSRNPYPHECTCYSISFIAPGARLTTFSCITDEPGSRIDSTPTGG